MQRPEARGGDYPAVPAMKAVSVPVCVSVCACGSVCLYETDEGS